MKTLLTSILLTLSMATHAALTLTEFGGVLDRDALTFSGSVLVDWDSPGFGETIHSLVFWEVVIEDGTVLSSNDWEYHGQSVGPGFAYSYGQVAGSNQAGSAFSFLVDFFGQNNGPLFQFIDTVVRDAHCGVPNPMCSSFENPGFYSGPITSINGVPLGAATVPIPAAFPLLLSALLVIRFVGHSRGSSV